MANAMRNMLAEAIYDRLVDQLITQVADPETRAGLVKIGKLQDDPTVALTNVLVRESEKADIPHVDSQGLNVGTTHEIGGAYFKRRYFKIYLEFFFDNEYDRDVARYKAWVLQARVEDALLTMSPPEDEDDFGETCTPIRSIESTLPREAGGEGEFIWKIEIDFFFVTEKSY